jgi:3',5'-cyclic AMP phosphodiesterase CpdA
MSTRVPLGPGTVSVKVGAGTAKQFEAECKSAAITHEYEDVGEAVTFLDGHTHGGSRTRTDGFKASLDNDLSSAGLYKFLVDNDLAEAALEYTPNSTAGAKWAGTVTLTLPSELGADEFGAVLASEVEWTGVGTFTFTPATAP